LRADFTMNDTYAYREDRPLDCPITCFGGEQDPETTKETLSAWSRQTRSGFALRMFPGGHFFLESARALLLQALIDDLQKTRNGGI
jgi:medium-chain acyl-[acyl-carrier-protein] hydrolase